LYETSQRKAERLQILGVRCHANRSEAQLAASSPAVGSLRPFLKTMGSFDVQRSFLVFYWIKLAARRPAAGLNEESGY
jgi:hypothetical protein